MGARSQQRGDSPPGSWHKGPTYFVHARSGPRDATPEPSVEPAEAVLQFLKSVGPRAESEFYLRVYRSMPREAFAAICVDGRLASPSDGGVAFDLRLLHYLALSPVVVLGLDSPAHARADAEHLLAHLRALGVPCDGPFGTDGCEAVRSTARAGQLPVLTLAQTAHADRIAALGSVLSALGTSKLVFLRQAGGLKRDGERISLVNLTTEVEPLREQAALSPAELAVVTAAQQLMATLCGPTADPPQATQASVTASITSPLNLLHELFTVRGAGTLLRRGAVVVRHEGLAGVDRAALLRALEASFARPMDEALLSAEHSHCYVADRYRGVALISDCPFGAYLDKFAVTPLARGEGVGRDLWQAVVNDHPTLLWRARAENPITAWYEHQSEGRFRRGEWTVYLRGIEPEQVPAAIAFAVQRPHT